MNNPLKPLVSVIMPIAGPPTWLAEALSSVAEQTYRSWEFVAYLDGPNPEAEAILESFGPRFSFLRGAVNEGAAAAGNRCIEAARGTLIARLDSDDKWTPTHLERSVAELVEDPNRVLVSCRSVHIDQLSRPISKFFLHRVDRNAKDLLQRNHVGHSGAVFRRDTAIQAGGYDPSVYVSFDYCLWLRMAQVGGVLVNSSRIYFYRIHPQQISGSRLPRTTLQSVRAARLALAKTLRVSRWRVLLWNWGWTTYRLFGPIKLLQMAALSPNARSSRSPIHSEQLNVMHIVNSLATGGAERLIADIVETSRNTGHKLSIICLTNAPGIPRDKAEELHLDIQYLGSFLYDPRLYSRLKKATSSADVIHAHLFPAIYLAAFLPQAKVMTEHSTENRRRGMRLLRGLERVIYNRYDAVIAVSDGVASALLAHMQNIGSVPPVTTIKNAIAARSSPRARRGVHSPLRLAFIGSLSERKDPVLAVRALAHLDDATLEIAGSGPLRRSLEQEIKRLDLGSRVTLRGEIADSAGLLASTDLLLSTSIFEGFGLVALEAHASGVPVVGPRVRGLDEVVVDGVSGLLFNSRDPGAIASEILRASEQATYRQLSTGALEVSTQFSLEVSLTEHIHLYKTVLGIR